MTNSRLSELRNLYISLVHVGLGTVYNLSVPFTLVFILFLSLLCRFFRNVFPTYIVPNIQMHLHCSGIGTVNLLYAMSFIFSQIQAFCKTCLRVPAFQGYVNIIHFLSTQGVPSPF
jgi:hypothetical protein